MAVKLGRRIFRSFLEQKETSASEQKSGIEVVPGFLSFAPEQSWPLLRENQEGEQFGGAVKGSVLDILRQKCSRFIDAEMSHEELGL